MPNDNLQTDPELLAALNEELEKPVYIELTKILKIFRLCLICLLTLAPFALAFVAYGIMSNRAEVQSERQKIEDIIENS